MSSKKARILNTDAGNLISNLRGEIGEIITSWLLMRHFMAEIKRHSSENVSEDIHNSDLQFLTLMKNKLKDELVGRLSEISEKKIGRLNFFFAAKKLDVFESDAEEFGNFIKASRIREKRNQDVSHKELPEKWSGHKRLGSGLFNEATI